MKKFFLRSALFILMMSGGCLGSPSWAAHPSDVITVRFAAPSGAPARSATSTVPDVVTLNGTGATATILVETKGLEQDVQLTATTGFSVTPARIKAGAEPTQVTVTNVSSRNLQEGKLILRSGDMRTYVTLKGIGTPLAVKDISANPVYAGGTDTEKSFDGFNPGENGYTVEVKAKTSVSGSTLNAYAVAANKAGFDSYIGNETVGLLNGASSYYSNEGISNPANGGTFYNTDGLYHTYRYAVTPDKRVFVYRDGIAVDTMRVADLALQPEWSVENGDMSENLIKNGDFEGEHNYSASRHITTRIEGWDVYPYDQYNSTQDIVAEERSNEVDQNNHVISIDRYMWSDGWSAAEISQVVDVAPNEVYSFSCLAKGGQYKGEPLGKIRIFDLQNEDNKVDLAVTSDSYETYATDFSTLANTKQIRVVLYLERAKWGASVSALKVDDVRLVGVDRLVKPQIGFTSDNADIAYFAFDNTGAYAPAKAELNASADSLTLDGTGATATFDVNALHLTAGNITVSATNGFEVSPATLDGNGTVTVKNISTLAHNTGKVILRSGDLRAYVNLTATGTPLAVKDISANPAYAGGTDTEKSFDGFNPGENGYTVEVKAKTSVSGSTLNAYAVAANKAGFDSYIGNETVGLLNGASSYYSNEGISNPANGGTFYNTDGLYHTYRYAVTPDKRVFVYRDGMPVDTMRVADLALQPEWSVENGDMSENLIKNGDFEGEHNYSASRHITTRIEGWDVYPYDQYNSTQDIVAEERSNEVDQNNHVISIDRYMWSDGWSAAEISQVVDVAPNEVYSFSCLAKGGQYKGEPLGKIRIFDLQNEDNKVDLAVTSDSYETYATDFSTLANTKQIRVVLYLERAKWGASVSALKVDDVRLVGVDRLVKPQIGFTSDNADIAYFAFDNTGAYAPAKAELTASADSLTLDGTGATATFDVNALHLTAGNITVSATNGFEVSPATLDGNGTVTVKNISTLAHNTGKVILRSGDLRAYVNLTATGTPLAVKDILANPVYAGGTDTEKSFDGFNPGENGYTVEVKAKASVSGSTLNAYAVAANKAGFDSYIGNETVGLLNGASSYYSNEGISNPANDGTFYNTDGLYHTYRYAVTPDKRVFVYRDGIAVDTMRVADLALQPEWSVENGDMSENLIKNGDFEGEHNFSKSRNITTRIEGWDVYPYDQYNSTQDIVAEERSNEVDQNNHVISIDRYMWSDGWSAAEISQVVDVAPNEVYSFSCLAKGGQYKGEPLGKIRIFDLQNEDNKVDLTVTSDSYETYATDFSTLANTKQIRVVLYLERAKWGASVSALKVDDVRLVGVDRVVKPQIGFTSDNADIAYFAFDNTGAYAPAFAELTASTDSLTLDGTGATESFTVNSANLVKDITVGVTHGFSVSPTTIKANSGKVTVKVTNTTSLAKNTGKVILRSGDMRTYVKLASVGSALEVKDISENPAYAGGTDEEMTFDSFNPSANGYTVEVRAKTDNSSKSLYPFAVSADKVGFESYITSSELGLYNGAPSYYSNEGISNPANGGTFYNTDGLYHTYRYAVTPDKRVFVYRDGLAVDTMRVADLALQPEWSVETGDPVRNMIKNGDFEGEHNFSKSRNITTRIEGWDVYPYDQYNSTQDIVAEERSNEVDQNNHVLAVKRYMWSDGWSAAEISQVVDVAPNEVYSFSCLAKGGQYKGEPLGKIRIFDLQNEDNKVDLTVTSDSYETYATDFSTLANTKQIRVVLYLERAKWGASVSALKVDDVKLTGYTRNVQQQIGFHNSGSDVAYFAFDNTGAYAPLLPGLTAKELTTAIKTATQADGTLKARVNNGMLYLTGVEKGSRVVVYATNGSVVGQMNDYTDDTAIGLPGHGVYVVAVFHGSKRQVVKVAN